MTQDPNKKTPRSFQCRDYLWEVFEQMSRDLECSVDYLVNEAMRQYARSRNYGVRAHSSSSFPKQQPSAQQPQAPTQRPPPRPPQQGPPQQPQSPPAQQGGIPSMGREPQAPGPPHPPNVPQPGQTPTGERPAQPPPPQQPPSTPGTPQQPGPMPGPPPPQPPGRGQPSMPPPLPGHPQQGQGPQQAPGPQAQAPPLYVIFNGQKIPVGKSEFVIGRGSKSADLPIKDGNISRRHAAVVYQQGAYYLKDLGSTNGVEYGGQRIDAKRIDEGDLFQICDYELRFTYR